jgi:hypothetical protein
MKIIDIPQSGHLGTFISFHTKHGQVRRPYVPPRDPRTPAQLIQRDAWAEAAPRWRALTELQRVGWRVLASQTHSHGRLADPGFLAGHQLHQKINGNRRFLGEPWLDDAPDLPNFGESPVGDLAITNTAGLITLCLPVSAAPVHTLLVFATRPGSAGALYPSRFVFIGLLPVPQNGLCDITQLYLAKYRALAPHDRVFIQTTQQLNGWRGLPRQTTAVVPTP